MSYAKDTTVAPEQSRAEIERTLMKYGASSFASGWQGTRALIQFTAHDRQIMFELTMPDKEDKRFTHYRHGSGSQLRRTSQEAIDKAWEQEVRRVWRALLLVVKAKLEAVATGISTFEDEFLANTVIPGPDGRPTTVGKFMQPQVAAAYESGQLPPGLMLALPPGEGNE